MTALIFQELQEEENVIRGPEQEESDHNGDDEPDNTVPLCSLHCHHFGNYSGIAGSHHQQGNHQTKYIVCKQLVNFPGIVIGRVVTSQSIGRICNFGENDSRQGDGQAQRPHRHCDDNASPYRAIPGPRERVQNDHVTI